MKALALERLKDTVSKLEIEAAKKSFKNKYLVIFDVGIYLDHLANIKKWLAGEKFVVLLPISGKNVFKKSD